MKIQNVLNNAMIVGVGGLAVSKVAHAAPTDRFEIARRAAAPVAAPVPVLAPVLAARNPDSVTQGTFSFDGSAPCSSDLAHFEISYNLKYQCSAPDASGVTHCSYHYSDHGTATTYDTGVKYQITDTSNQQQYVDFSAGSEVGYGNLQGRASEQGSGNVFTSKVLVEFTNDPVNGLQLSFKKNDYQCN